MLLGCCHCDGYVPPPSESLPPSSGSSSGSSIWTPDLNPFDCSASHCIGSVSANAYNLAFDIGTNTLCGVNYSGTFTLTARDSFVFGLCIWESSELAKKNNGGTCGNHLTRPRFSFQMAQNTTSARANGRRYSLVVNAHRQSGFSVIDHYLVYAGNLGNSAPGASPTAKINCLGSITLPLFASSTTIPTLATSGAQSFDNTFYYGVTGTNPYGSSPVPWSYQQGLYPSSVTLTPA